MHLRNIKKGKKKLLYLVYLGMEDNFKISLVIKMIAAYDSMENLKKSEIEVKKVTPL